MQRYAVARVVFHLFGGEAILKPGANDAGGNAVHPDIQIGQFARQRPRELRYRALSHPVGNGTRTTAGPRRRGISRIAPPPRSTMRGTAARARWYTAWTWMSKARYQVQASTSSKPPFAGPPAQWTSTSSC